jgi:hypothetical protein
MRLQDLIRKPTVSIKETAPVKRSYRDELSHKLNEKTNKLLDKKTPTVAELAEKYKTSILAVEMELKKGVKVEMEHTSKHSVAKEIALDHLNEDLHYYEKLAKVEKEIDECVEGVDCDCDDEMDEAAAWQKKSGKNKNGGLNKKGVASYRREHPGSKLQTAVTTKPSKLKKGSKAAKRRKSFCARMRGMKKSRTSAKTAHDPNSRINKSLRKWHCESIEEMRELIMLGEQYIANLKENFADGKHPEDKGDSHRHGIPKKASLSQLDKITHSKSASPRKKQLAHWQANMRRGREKH